MISKETVASNFIWRFMERCGAQAVTFIVSIILARLLDPEVYGTVALIAVFTTILGVFVDCGMGSALVQKKNADNLDFSSVFYFNLIMSIIIYVVLFIGAPFIANFYEIPELKELIRVMSLTMFTSGVKNIQISFVSRNLLFKKFFFVTLVGTIIAAITGITMALLGFGVWALVIQNIVHGISDVIMLWMTVKWRPKCFFSFSRLKELFNFGWKLLVSQLLETSYNQLRTLLIGKLYTTSDLAFYEKGNNFPSIIITNIVSSLDSVLFPTMSKEQDNIENVRDITSKAIKTSTYLIMPCMVGLAVCAKPLIVILLTEKWLPIVPFMRIFCFTYAFYPLHTANLNAIRALGRSDLYLKLEVIKKTMGLVVLLVTIPISVMAMAYSLLFTSVASQIINSWPNRKILNYSYLQQIKDLFPGMLLSLTMGVIVFPVQFLGFSDIVTLGIQVPLGIIIYILGSKLFKIDSYEYVKNTTVNIVKSKKITNR